MTFWTTEAKYRKINKNKKEKLMGAAMDEYKAKYGEDSGMTREQIYGPNRPISIGAKSPNGMALALISCKCGATFSSPLQESFDDYDNRYAIRFENIEGWLIDLVRGIIRCPQHRTLI